MESKPTLEARSPALIETLAGLLIPPAAREHVLGDLYERFRSSGSFVADVVRTLPFVLRSQIRRTTRFLFWPLVGVMLMGGLGLGQTDASLVPSLVPALATLIGFMFRDAYKVIDLRRPWRQGITDALVASAFTAAAEGLMAVAAPRWVIAPAGAVGFLAVLALLGFLRAQNPGSAAHWRPSTATTISLSDLRLEIAAYERVIRRAARIEVGVGLALIPVFLLSVAVAPGPLLRTASALTVAGIVFVVRYLWPLLRLPAIPTDAGFATTVELYRVRLERNHEMLRTFWAWYLLALGAGPAVFFGSAAATAPNPLLATAPLLVLLVMSMAIWQTVSTQAQSLRQRIEALTAAKEAR